MTRDERIQAAALSLPCSRCPALPGDRCRSKRGNVVTHVHADRWYEGRNIVIAEERAHGIDPE